MVRLSGPLLDRIDIHVAMRPFVPLDYLVGPSGEASARSRNGWHLPGNGNMFGRTA